MKIEPADVTIRKLAEGYEDNNEGGVIGYNGLLDIRPPYQREFIYKDKKRDAVITSVLREFPLNAMYWAVKDDGKYEIIDGQQRTISICQYINGDFAYENRYFYNLQKNEQEDILSYKLMVYLCDGTDSERLEWFRTINIAGEKLTDQELRNAVYSGSWVTDAKRYFSKNQCPAYDVGHKYVSGTVNRQEYLEEAIKWKSNDNIEAYMAEHQHQPTADDLWLHFQNVISWVKVVFPGYREEMKGVDWGILYDEFKDKKIDSKSLERQVKELMENEAVQRKKGIYAYVLTGKEKHLNIRKFSDKQKREAYERQEGKCAICGKHFEITQMEADHKEPWHKGGKTDSGNCQVLCIEDNRQKGGK